ncbi:MAG: hypothetical protein AAGG01_08120, partial [Planctomycetota bacterium]
MVGLVLLNLVFVQLTEAASMAWLLPLYGLTLASWGLARFKERFLYRALWNLGVLGFFVKLLNHALSADLAYVLQDGLTLAVLCQVHLLNNLHRNQRPDLLFLNSYLIAVITGYITVDLGFAGAFLGYVPFYILGLQFLAVFRPGAKLSRREVRLLAFDGFRRSAVLLTLALLAFAFWPRDFEREALLARYFEFDTSSGPAKVDFSESLDLAKRRENGGDAGAVVLTIRDALRTGSALGSSRVDVPAVPELWRGAVLTRHRRDGSWARATGDVRTADPRWWAPGSPREAVREPAADAPARRLSVVRAGGSTRVAFLPYASTRIALDGVHRAGVLELSDDGTVRYSNPGELRYDVVVQQPLTANASSGDAPSGEALTRLEPSPHTKTAVDLARLLREKRVDPDLSDSELAQAFSDYLRDRYPYRLPSGDEADASATLHEFLTTNKGGHCEFFAS